MGHGAILTDDEYAGYQLHREVERYVRAWAAAHTRRPQDMRILDWGCGRGLAVGALRTLGFDAYGVDIDPDVIERGRVLLLAEGVIKADSLRTIGPGNRCDFPDAYFDFVFSDQVFEHVEDLNSMSAEIARVTVPWGGGFHRYPAHRRLVEPHLFMPLVHWLPKNRLRREAIRACVLAGIEPSWPELNALRTAGRTLSYYGYSVSSTHYRAPAVIARSLRNHGLIPRFVSLDHPAITERRIFAGLLRLAPLRWMAETLVQQMWEVELTIVKENHDK